MNSTPPSSASSKPCSTIATIFWMASRSRPLEVKAFSSHTKSRWKKPRSFLRHRVAHQRDAAESVAGRTWLETGVQTVGKLRRRHGKILSLHRRSGAGFSVYPSRPRNLRSRRSVDRVDAIAIRLCRVGVATRSAYARVTPPTRDARNFGLDTLDHIIHSRPEYTEDFRKDYFTGTSTIISAPMRNAASPSSSNSCASTTSARCSSRSSFPQQIRGNCSPLGMSRTGSRQSRFERHQRRRLPTTRPINATPALTSYCRKICRARSASLPQRRQRTALHSQHATDQTPTSRTQREHLRARERPSAPRRFYPAASAISFNALANPPRVRSRKQ